LTGKERQFDPTLSDIKERNMPNTRSTSIEHCTPEQLKALLALGRDDSGPRNSLPTQVTSRSELSRLLTELCEGTDGSGEALLATVSAKDTPLIALVGTKELAKTLVSKAPTELHRGAATVLYHLAVAAALALWGENISAVSPKSRVPLYEDLAIIYGRNELGRIFREAADKAIPAP
jgi:hypothetical protein